MAMNDDAPAASPPDRSLPINQSIKFTAREGAAGKIAFEALFIDFHHLRVFCGCKVLKEHPHFC
jgi:hypothetical protein